MSDKTKSLFVTQRLQRIAEATDEELESTGDTLELEDLGIMETAELKQLLDPDEIDRPDGGESGGVDRE